MAYITGWGHTKFGRLEGDLEALIQDAAREALSHAGLEASDIDAVFVGNFNAGLVDDAFISSAVFNLDDGFRFKPSTRLENACASGSAAVYAARNYLDAGRGQRVLVIGAEKMTALDTKGVTEALGRASYQREEAGMSFPAIFGRVAGAYFQKYGDSSEALAKIAVKNHQHAMDNPLAQLQRDVSFEFANTVSEKNPMIAAPLRLTDCSLISDGAAALVMVSDELVDESPRAVGFRAAVQMNDFHPMSKRDLPELPALKKAITTACTQAGVTVDDIDSAEVHDCFTIAELLIYEAMGLADAGQGARVVEDGTVAKGGKLPVNLSGGLKAKGHPVGATGVSMHVLSARQVMGEAGAMQVPDATLSMVFNMGGLGVANYASILERVR